MHDGTDPRTHFAFPFTWDGGAYSVVVQDTPEEVLQGVVVLFETRRGERIEVPDYGIDDPTFSTVIDRSDLLRAVETYAPRALVTVTDSVDPVDELVRQVEVQTELRGI